MLTPQRMRPTIIIIAFRKPQQPNSHTFLAHEDMEREVKGKKKQKTEPALSSAAG